MVMESIYARGRDNARTPMQWDSSANAGFTEGIPWIEVNPNYTSINVEEELKDPDSVFYFYQKLIRLRKEYPIFVNGTFKLLLPEDEQIFAYERSNEDTRLLVCANFSGKPAICPVLEEWKDADVLIQNYEGSWSEELKPYEALILMCKN